MLDNPKNKTKIWTAISTGLQEFNIKMSSDQVRWKMNYLMKKYKECIDNNTKSGRSIMTFEFFNEMDKIFGYKNNATTAIHTRSSNIFIQESRTSAGINKNIQCKKLKTDHLDHLSSTTSKDSNTDETKSENQIKVSHRKNVINLQTKSEVEKVLLEFIQAEQKRHQDRDDEMFKTKKEALKLKQYDLEMREKELNAKKTIATNKIRAKERRHEELLEIEKLKYNLLKKLGDTCSNNYICNKTQIFIFSKKLYSTKSSF